MIEIKICTEMVKQDLTFDVIFSDEQNSTGHVVNLTLKSMFKDGN